MPALTDTSTPWREPTFTLRNRFFRGLFQLVWMILCRWTPPPCHSWRSWILRCFGARIGRGAHIYASVAIWAPWNLTIGNESCLAPGVVCYCMDVITIGDRVTISQGAHLCTGTHDYSSPKFQLMTRPITIHNQAWICAEAFIHPGISIGEGAIAGARSVVTKDLPPWMVCAGNPCKPIKPRALSKDSP